MIKKHINQKDSFDIELLSLIGHDYVFSNNPINRLEKKISVPNKFNENKREKLIKLKQELNSIKDCN